MLVSLAVIGFMLLLVIYFFVRSQGIEKELKRYKHQSKAAGVQAKNALVTVDALAIELQKMLSERLESARRRQLIAGEQHDAVKALYAHIEKVVMHATEHNASVADSLEAAFKNKSPGLQEIKLFISKQPNEVKLPWSRNNLSSFITTCVNIAVTIENPGNTKQAQNELPETPEN